jgi:hypothetical protein
MVGVSPMGLRALRGIAPLVAVATFWGRSIPPVVSPESFRKSLRLRSIDQFTSFALTMMSVNGVVPIEDSPSVFVQISASFHPG